MTFAQARARLAGALSRYGETIAVEVATQATAYDPATGRNVTTTTWAEHVSARGMYQPTQTLEPAIPTRDGAALVRGHVFLPYDASEPKLQSLDTLGAFRLRTSRNEVLTPIMKPVLENDAPVVWRISVGDRL